MTTGALAGTVRIAEDDPESEDIRELLGRHLAYSAEQTPADYSFALGVDGLADPSVTLFSARDAGGALLGIAALRQWSPELVEVKSMHTAAEARRRGVGSALLRHLVGVARARGACRINLETGSMPAYSPARAMYAAAGFSPCDPFGDYRPSPYNTFMTLELVPEGPVDS